MHFPVLDNQWNPVGGALQPAQQLLERASSIATRVVLAAAAARIGLWLAKMGISQVCPERELQHRCILDADSATFIKALRVCDKEWPEKALVDLANPPFGWEVDPIKREKALVDPTHPPLGWKYSTYEECLITNMCKPLTETNFCKGVDFVEGAISTISEKVDSIVGNLHFLRPAVQIVSFMLNRIARRV